MFKAFARFRSRFLVLLTGTPVKKGPQNLFAPLHLVSPYAFPSYWKFINKYCIVTQDMFGRTIEPRPKDPKLFKEVIKPFLLRRRKKEVLHELPPLQRVPIYLTMTPKQQQYYEELADTGILNTPNGIIACPNEAVKLLRLRQILVTPKIFGYSEPGAALNSLKEIITDSFDNDDPIAICTPFKIALDCIEEIIKPLTPHLYRIQGGMKLPARTVADMFQKSKDRRKALIFTITSGMSFDAYAANRVVFVGAEWVSIDNAQAESRVHRMGQDKSVDANYMLYPDTIDDAILERLNENTMAANWTLEVDRMLALLEKQRKRNIK
jgi:SNF2 family DNA or RNA helicase